MIIFNDENIYFNDFPILRLHTIAFWSFTNQSSAVAPLLLVVLEALAFLLYFLHYLKQVTLSTGLNFRKKKKVSWC